MLQFVAGVLQCFVLANVEYDVATFENYCGVMLQFDAVCCRCVAVCCTGKCGVVQPLLIAIVE